VTTLASLASTRIFYVGDFRNSIVFYAIIKTAACLSFGGRLAGRVSIPWPLRRLYGIGF